MSISGRWQRGQFPISAFAPVTVALCCLLVLLSSAAALAVAPDSDVSLAGDLQISPGSTASNSPLGFLAGDALKMIEQNGFRWLPVDPEPVTTPFGSVSTLALHYRDDPIFEARIRCHYNHSGLLVRMVIPRTVLALLGTVTAGKTGSDAKEDAAQSIEMGTWRYSVTETEARAARRIAMFSSQAKRVWLIRRSTPAQRENENAGAIGLSPAYLIDNGVTGFQQDQRLIYDADNGELLLNQRLSRQFDQVGAGYVFDPNPVVASGNPDLTENDNVDPWRVEVTLHNLDGSGHLRGDWAVISSPAVEAFSGELSYFYTSRNLHFEEVMSYYHITEAQRYVQSLGFTMLNNRAQSVTVHASGFDESWFSPLEKKIYFGDGGVDDAEDADVILHEYGHALFQAAVGGTGTSDLDAINEGFADYFAASRTGDPKIGDWNAYHRTGGCHRNISELRRYPIDLCGEPHADGMIWGGLLWRVQTRLGNLIADGLAIHALYYLTPRSTWEDAARALLAAGYDYADNLGNPGITAIVKDALAERGFLPQTGQGVLDTAIGEQYQSIPLRFGFVAPGCSEVLAVDSLFVGPNGLILLHPVGGADPDLDPAEYQTRLPALAPLMVQGGQWQHDEVALSWSGDLSHLALEIQFITAGKTIRRTEARFTADGTIDVAWFGDGCDDSFPGLSGWFPAGMDSELTWFDLPLQNAYPLAPGEAVAALLPAGSFNLVGARMRYEPVFEAGAEFYQAVMLSQPIPISADLAMGLQTYPSPAKPGDRIAFKIATAGIYHFQITDVTGRKILSEKIMAHQPGLYDFRLPENTATAQTLSSGTFFLHLSGGTQTRTGKLLLIK